MSPRNIMQYTPYLYSTITNGSRTFCWDYLGFVPQRLVCWVSAVPELLPVDYLRRTEFCVWITNKIENDGDCLKKLIVIPGLIFHIRQFTEYKNLY